MAVECFTCGAPHDWAAVISGQRETIRAMRTQLGCGEKNAYETRRALELSIVTLNREIGELREQLTAAAIIAASAAKEHSKQVAELTRERDALSRECDRWRHGQEIEGDHVCPNDFDAQRLRTENLTLAAQVKAMREALERARLNVSAEGSWCISCRTESPRVDGLVRHKHAAGCVLSAEPTATERFVRAAIDVAEFWYGENKTSNIEAVREAYRQAKAATEGAKND